jgi:hypothetical protein
MQDRMENSKPLWFVTADKNGLSRRISIPGHWTWEGTRQYLEEYGYTNIQIAKDLESADVPKADNSQES